MEQIAPISQPKATQNRKLIIGIAALLVVLILVAVVVLITQNRPTNNTAKNTQDNTASNNNNQTSNQNSNTNSTEKIVLTNLGINFGKYDEQTGRAGAFIFDKNELKSNSPFPKIFLEFGSTKTEGGKVVEFPEIIYSQVDADTDITALADGKVVTIEDQPESNDKVLAVVFGDNWAVIYDHIINLNVQVGDIIKAGDILGKVSLNRDGITGFTEIQVKQVHGSSQTSYCPLSLLSAEVQQTYENNFKTLMADWEAYYGDTTIYDEAAQPFAGCVKETIVE